MIGSEGTLGFISEITYRTVPEYADKASALILFGDLETACRAVTALKSAPVAAVELADRAALRSVEAIPGLPQGIRALGLGGAALLVETRAANSDVLADQVRSATTEVAGDRPLDAVKAPTDLSDVGVVRAVYGVAETGSVWITGAQFKVNSLGFLSQHLVVLLDPARILVNMHHAYRERAQFDTGYGVFMTGPSATADIEGVLIHGAQGIRTLTVVLIASR